MDLDADGSLWRFRMEKVLDVEFVSWGDPDPDGTEVCWRLERRRNEAGVRVASIAGDLRRKTS